MIREESKSRRNAYVVDKNLVYQKTDGKGIADRLKGLYGLKDRQNH